MYIYTYTYELGLSRAVAPLQPSLILRQGWKNWTRGLKPPIAFLCSMRSWSNLSYINSICFSLWGCLWPRCSNKVLSVIVLLILPQRTWCLQLITFDLYPWPFPLQKKKVMWKPLSGEISLPPSLPITKPCSPLWAFLLAAWQGQSAMNGIAYKSHAFCMHFGVIID